MKQQINAAELDIIIPISLELDWPTREEAVAVVRQQHERYGFTRFCLAAPCGGWRSAGYPPKERYRELAELFKLVRDDLAPEGVVCGWWNTLTVKSGPSDEFARMTRADGSETPFASCPLDPNFRARLAGDIAFFAEIARPAFIVLEDDYSVHASSALGCFCEHHLDEFARRQGRRYTREKLADIFAQSTPEAFQLLRQWRKLAKDSLVGLSEAIRAAVDKKTPEIPIGYMQSGAADADGDCTEAVSRALAGPDHTPFSRLYGAFYNGGETQSIPSMLYHPLYSKQHIRGDFLFYHESDTFPHTRFFSSGAQMRAIMAAAYSYGFDGSTFQTQQLLDDPNEETIYGKTYAGERTRFNALHRAAKLCALKGVQLCYDPFWNTADRAVSDGRPLWTRCVSLFGIPHGTADDRVAFWDIRQAKHADDAEIKARLAKGLFLDGDAAKRLCERGYGEYLGVALGEDVAAASRLQYDLGAREIIREPFRRLSPGKNMPSAHMFANGKNGKLLRIEVTDPACEVISDEYTFQGNYVSPAMTRFENRLGGRVVVMGMTLEHNESQSLFNYRRQRLFHELLVWCADEYAFVKNEANVFVIMNEAINPGASGFRGMLTLINLCDDALEHVSLHLPPKWREGATFRSLGANGEWKTLNCSATEDGVRIDERLALCEPACIMVI